MTANGTPVPPRIAAELALIRERADRVDELACITAGAATSTWDDVNDLYDMLRNVAGSLQVLVVYLEEQQR